VNGIPTELVAQLRELERSLRRIKQQQGSGLPSRAVSLLRYIDDLDTGCHGRDLAARTGLDPSTVSRAVAGLVSQGLVERRADPADGRASVLAVTPAGVTAVADAHRWLGEVLARALADWTPDELSVLTESLGRFSRDVDSVLSHDDTLEAAR
jgi:DNA-binding MarR family transcriptional regulator